MKLFPSILAFILAACVPLDEETMADLGPYRETVGIRQVTHNGAKLEAAMRLEITGGEIETVTAADGEKTYKLDLGTLATSAEVVSLQGQITLLQAGGKWAMPPIFVGSSGPESITLTLGSMQRTNLQNYGFGDVLTVTLPLVGAADVGRRIGLAETGTTIGPVNGVIEILASGGQEIDVGRIPPYLITGMRPRVTFVAAEHSPGVYGWITESKDAD